MINSWFFTRQLLKGIPADLVDMESFWHHSVSTGVIARLLAYDINCRERIFIAGLLHGIGKMILINQFPEEYSQVLRTANKDAEVFHDIEQQVFGFTYAELSTELLKAWKLPESIWKIVEFHLNPTSATGKIIMDANTLHLAVKIASLKQVQQNNENLNLDEIESLCKPAIWENLGLNAEVIELVNSVADLQIADMYNFIKPTAT